MVVKRVVSPRKAAKAAKPAARFKKTGGSVGSSSPLTLPTQKSVPNDNFFSYTTLIYGRPGIGKTTFAASFPNCVLFSCERVSKGVVAFDFNREEGGVKNWEIFRKGVQLLESNPGQFDAVVIDTIDAAYAHCMDWVCKKKGIEHPGDEGFGKGWNAVKLEFAGQIDRIYASGRGVIFTSHAKEADITSASGQEYTVIKPTMSGQAYAYCKAKTDYVFYCEYIKDVHGKTRRVLITTGDEVVDAKHASGHPLPLFIPLDLKKGVQVVIDAFNGKGVGIPPEEVRSAKDTSKGGESLIRREKAKGAKEKIQKTVRR